MSLRPLPKKSLVDQTIDQMTQAVLSGQWKVGDKIPTEPVLCEELGVSRGTAREAVKALAHRGILEVRQGSGTYVATDNELLAPIKKAIDDTSVDEALYLRAGLEMSGIMGAVKNITEHDIEQMKIVLEKREIARKKGDKTQWIEAELDFHEMVVEASHNHLLISIYKGLRNVLQQDLVQQLEKLDSHIPVTKHGHETLVSALEKGDRKLAMDEAQRNFDHVRETFDV